MAIKNKIYVDLEIEYKQFIKNITEFVLDSNTFKAVYYEKMHEIPYKVFKTGESWQRFSIWKHSFSLIKFFHALKFSDEKFIQNKLVKESGFDLNGISKLKEDIQKLGDYYFVLITLACVFHDMGKIVNPTINHHIVAIDDMKRCLEELNLHKEDIDWILDINVRHSFPLEAANFGEGSPASMAEVFHIQNKLGETNPFLLALCTMNKADILSAAPPEEHSVFTYEISKDIDNAFSMDKANTWIQLKKIIDQDNFNDDIKQLCLDRINKLSIPKVPGRKINLSDIRRLSINQQPGTFLSNELYKKLQYERYSYLSYQFQMLETQEPEKFRQVVYVLLKPNYHYIIDTISEMVQEERWEYIKIMAQLTKSFEENMNVKVTDINIWVYDDCKKNELGHLDLKPTQKGKSLELIQI